MVAKAKVIKDSQYEAAPFLRTALEEIFDWQVQAMDAVLELSDEASAQADAIDDLIDNTEVIQPELSALLATTIGMGIGLAEILEANLEKFDELGQKRVRAAAMAYRQSAQLALNRIEEVTIDPEDMKNEEEPEVEAAAPDVIDQVPDVIDQALDSVGVDAVPAPEVQP